MRETFGKYQLERRLAFGGMAEVYLGSVHGEAGFSKPVVIKRLHPRLNEDSEFVQMLIDEARITSQLSHSNICQVLDLGSVDDSYYIAMEFIAGEDLRTLQDCYGRNGEFVPVDAAVHIVCEVLAGLDYAHSKEDAQGQPMGVIHRDISPQNVLISYEGEVKVIDFGIAKAKSRVVQTQAGVIKGKFRYMSPEQASGRAIDQRTDVFAAGVVLYELLRGRPHSVDVPDTEVLRRMRDAEFEPIQRDRKEVPDQLLRIVSKALARKQRKRFSSAGEYRQALLRFLQARGSTFGRSDLAALMKAVFPIERRRERAGHKTGSRSQSSILPPRQPMAQTQPPRVGGPGGRSERAISGEIGSRAGLAMAKTTHSESHARPPELPRTPTEEIEEDRFGGLSPVPTGAQTRAPTGQRQTGPPRRPPADGTHQLEIDDLELVGGGRVDSRARDPMRTRAVDAVEYGRTTSASPADDQRTELRGPQAAAYGAHYPGGGDDSSAPGSYGSDDGYDDGYDDDYDDRVPAPPPMGAPPSADRERATHVAGTGRRQQSGQTGQRRPAERGGHSGREAGRTMRGAGAFTHAKAERYGKQRFVRAGGVSRVEPSRTEHIQAAKSGGGLGKALAIVIVIGALGAGAFYVGRAHLGLGGDGTSKPSVDAAVARRPDQGEPIKPDLGRKKKPRPLGRTGKLQVASRPEGAAILLCGTKTGQVTPAALSLRRGRRCLLELRLAGYASYKRRVWIGHQRRRALTVSATLKKLATKPSAGTGGSKPPANKGRLVVTSIQVGKVLVGDRVMGRTPKAVIDLPPGRYRVVVSFSSLGRRSTPRTVTIRRGGTTKLYISPDP